MVESGLGRTSRRVFGLRLLTMILLMLLSYSTTYYYTGAQAADISFVITESLHISKALSPVFGIIFLAVVVVMLFQTQLGVMDSTSRIMAENFALKKMEMKKNRPSAFQRYIMRFYGRRSLLERYCSSPTLKSPLL